MHYIPTWPCHTWFGKPFNHLHVQNWWKCMSSVGIMTKRIWKHCIFCCWNAKNSFPPQWSMYRIFLQIFKCSNIGLLQTSQHTDFEGKIEIKSAGEDKSQVVTIHQYKNGITDACSTADILDSPRHAPDDAPHMAPMMPQTCPKWHSSRRKTTDMLGF